MLSASCNSVKPFYRGYNIKKIFVSVVHGLKNIFYIEKGKVFQIKNILEYNNNDNKKIK